VIGIFYKASPNGCRHKFTNPVEAKALPHEGASALVRVSCLPMLYIARQTAVERQDFSRTYLAHHELESGDIIISTIIIIIHSCLCAWQESAE